MKKKHFSFVAVLVLIFSFAVALSSCSQKESRTNVNETLHWIPEESTFVDYVIDGDRIRFRYSVCFKNGTKDDQCISLSATFRRDELSEWVKYEPLFEGCDESGERLETVIRSGEKKKVLYVFEGEYLGGPVNTRLSFPEYLTLVNRIPDEA